MTNALEGVVPTAFSYLGWAFLPSYATSILQSFYYRLVLPAGTAPPHPSTAQFARDHRRIRTLVLTLYLVYTLVQSLHDIRVAGDFYTLLGVTPTSPDREIKAKFRRLAAKYHPDKLSSSSSSAAAAAVGEQIFVHLKLASDTLLNPSLRFAYDRFGPVITTITRPQLQTIRDYVYAGLRAKVPHYAGDALFLILLNATVLPRWGQFWRYFSFALLVVLELYLLTHQQQHQSYFSSLIHLAHNTFPNLVPPHLLPFQILRVAQRLSMSLNIFISQLAPRAGSGGSINPNSSNGAAQLQYQTQQQALHLSSTANRLDAETTQLLQLGLTPFKGDEAKTQILRQEMRQGLMMGFIKSSDQVKEAVQSVLNRRRGRRSQGQNQNQDQNQNQNQNQNQRQRQPTREGS